MIIKQRMNIFLASCLFLVFISLDGVNSFRNHLTNNDLEQVLIAKLLKSYMKNQKPAGTVEIKFALNLNQIVMVKAKDQVFMLNTFLDHEWTDPRLSWSK